MSQLQHAPEPSQVAEHQQQLLLLQAQRMRNSHNERERGKMTTLNELAKQIQQIEHSKKHVWTWEFFDRALNLLHDEVSEVSEAWRDNERIKVAHELADCLIRILHYFADCSPETNIDFLVNFLIEQNAKRPPHHKRERNPFESGVAGREGKETRQ